MPPSLPEVSRTKHIHVHHIQKNPCHSLLHHRSPTTISILLSIFATMTKPFIVLLAGLLTLGNTFAQTNDSWKKVKETGTGKLSVIYFDSPGLITNSSGQLKGLCVDILNDFSAFVKTTYNKTLTIDYISAEKDFQQFLNKVQTSDYVLGVTGINITESRKQIFKFTPSYLTSPTVLITNKEVANVSQPTDLADLAPYSLSKGAHSDVIKDLLKKIASKKEITFLASPEDIVEKVSVTPKSFTVLGINDYLEAARRGLNVKVQNMKVGTPEVFGFIMPKKSDWDVAWSAFLTEKYLNSPSYKKSISTNLGNAYLNFVKNQK
jgi:ABC-type amino acid transport substrate-binding protein